MQEEVTQKTIALSVKTARVTADVLKNMLRKYLSGQKQKGKNPYKVGKQSYKELKSQGSGLSNIEITDGNIKSFERVAKKYRLDFALKKDSSTKPPTYYVFFKGQDTEMMNLILQIADTLEVEAIALSGSRTNPQATKDEFQDYDVVYIVDDLEELISDLSWLDQFGNRLIEQHNRLGHRRLYLMLFEDGNRIDLTL